MVNENIFFLKFDASFDIMLELIKNTIPREILLTNISNENEYELQKILFNQRLVLNIQNNNNINYLLFGIYNIISCCYLNRDFYIASSTITEYFDNEEKIVSNLIKNVSSLEYNNVLLVIILTIINKGNVNLMMIIYETIVKNLQKFRKDIYHLLDLHKDEKEDDDDDYDDFVYNNKSNVIRDDPRLKLKQKYLKIQTIFEITVLIQNVDVMMNIIKLQMKIRLKIYSKE